MMRRMLGFSMVELMVATALGLLISAAAIQLFLANQVSLNFQRGMNDVQANGRFAIDQMVHDIRLAGLSPASSISSSSIPVVGLPFSTSDIPGLPNTSTAIIGDAKATTTGVKGLLTASDQLVVQYLALEDSTDCEGNTIAAGRYLIARYFIRLDNGVPALACDSGNRDDSTMDTAAGTAYGNAGAVLLSGVDSFQVQYGIDDGANGAARVSRYVNAATYAAMAAPRPTILAVRIGLYLHSQERATNTPPVANDVRVLDQTIAAGDVPTDGLLRRLFVTTISMRNVVLSGV